MPKRDLLSGGRVLMAAKRASARYGVKAAIVVAGAVLAYGSAHTVYLPQAPLAQRVTAAAPTGDAASSALASRVVSGGLTTGLDHARVQEWIARITGKNADDFARVLDRKDKYAPMITAKLEERRMPRDLVYLAMIESEFNPTARSRVHAVGLWQFMSSTARRFGLAVGSGVDERKDPARATDAALTYLSQLHDRFGSWYLAAAAYNSGEGTVQRALKRVLGRTKGTDEDFFRIASVLPRETRDYVPKLIATAAVGNAPEQYGIPVASETFAGEVTPVVPAVLREPASKASAPKRHATSHHRVAKRATPAKVTKRARTTHHKSPSASKSHHRKKSRRA